jgi:hypothetical protein
MKVSILLIQRFWDLVYKDYDLDINKFNEIGFEIKSQIRTNFNKKNDIILSLELSDHNLTLLDVILSSVHLISIANLNDVYKKVSFDNLTIPDENFINYCLKNLEIDNLNEFGFEFISGKIINNKTLYSDEFCLSFFRIFFKKAIFINPKNNSIWKNLTRYSIHKDIIKKITGQKITTKLISSILNTLNKIFFDTIFDLEHNIFKLYLYKKCENDLEIIEEIIRLCGFNLLSNFIYKFNEKKVFNSTFLNKQILRNNTKQNLILVLENLGFKCIISNRFCNINTNVESINIINPMNINQSAICQCIAEKHILEKDLINNSFYEFMFRYDNLYLELTTQLSNEKPNLTEQFLLLIINNLSPRKNIYLLFVNNLLLINKNIFIKKTIFHKNGLFFEHLCINIELLINILNDEWMLINYYLLENNNKHITIEFNNYIEYYNFIINKSKKNICIVKNIFIKNEKIFATFLDN